MAITDPPGPARLVTAKLLLQLIAATGHARLVQMSHATDLVIAHDRGLETVEIQLKEIATLLREQIAGLRASLPADSGDAPLRGILALSVMLDEQHKQLCEMHQLREKTACLLDVMARNELTSLTARADREAAPPEPAAKPS